MTATLTPPLGAIKAPYPEIEKAYLAHIRENFPEHEDDFVADMHTVWSAGFLPEDYDTAIHFTTEHRELKEGILDELHKLSVTFPKIPAILWHCIAHVVLREDPFMKTSLLRDAKDTFMHGDAVLNDTALHAAGIVTKLMFIINGRLMNRFGVIIIHGHSCDCCVEARTGGNVSVDLTPEEIEDLSTCFFGHFCGEWIKTRVLGLPLPI